MEEEVEIHMLLDVMSDIMGHYNSCLLENVNEDLSNETTSLFFGKDLTLISFKNQSQVDATISWQVTKCCVCAYLFFVLIHSSWSFLVYLKW